MKKLLYVVPLLLIGAYFLFAPSKAKFPKLNQARLILSELRGGDFAHPGDREAVDMVMTKIKQENKNKVDKSNVMNLTYVKRPEL